MHSDSGFELGINLIQTLPIPAVVPEKPVLLFCPISFPQGRASQVLGKKINLLSSRYSLLLPPNLSFLSFQFGCPSVKWSQERLAVGERGPGLLLDTTRALGLRGQNGLRITAGFLEEGVCVRKRTGDTCA